MMTCNRTTKGGKKRLLRFLYQGHDKLLQISDQCIKGILVVFAYVGQIRSRNKLLFTCVPKLGDQILMACESLPHGIIWTAKLIFLRTIRPMLSLPRQNSATANGPPDEMPGSCRVCVKPCDRRTCSTRSTPSRSVCCSDETRIRLGPRRLTNRA